MSARVLLGLRNNERLAARRRTRRRGILLALGVLVLAVCAGALVGLQQNAVRISRVEVFGADPSLAVYATEAMRGSYLGIVPRDSIFFFPEAEIRANIVAAHRDIAALSIFRSGFDSLSIKVTNRTAITRWCGLAPTVGVEEYCYVFDANGVIFAAAASTTETINPFKLYAPLAASTSEPLGATISNAEDLPATFDFARQLGTLGSPASSVVIHDGEVSDYLYSGTRVTYVLGNEQNAFTALVSARDTFNLTDGSLIYVDLRFDGKVYLKKKSDTVAE